MRKPPNSRRVPSPKPKAGSVDLVVGARLRLRRQIVGMTQADLAAALNIAQQQLQKYEAGQNRISAVRLYEAAKLLQAPIAWFYEGLDDSKPDAVKHEPSQLSELEVGRLLEAYAGAPHGRQKLRKLLQDLIDPANR
jgi:transcriptional regulator with XRE-family HTH domain